METIYALLSSTLLAVTHTFWDVDTTITEGDVTKETNDKFLDVLNGMDCWVKKEGGRIPEYAMDIWWDGDVVNPTVEGYLNLEMEEIPVAFFPKGTTPPDTRWTEGYERAVHVSDDEYFTP